MKNKEQRLIENMKMISVELTDKQVSQFIKFYEMLVEWNKVMNLTGITEYDEVVMKHFVDSLSIVKVNGFDNVTSIIDVGTGAGFPGIPLKIVFPEIKITLLDSLNKRIRFLNAVIDELELENIETIHGRAEDFSKKEDYREQYDLCVSRAVANLASFIRILSFPYVKCRVMVLYLINPEKLWRVKHSKKSSTDIRWKNRRSGKIPVARYRYRKIICKNKEEQEYCKEISTKSRLAGERTIIRLRWFHVKHYIKV